MSRQSGYVLTLILSIYELGHSAEIKWDTKECTWSFGDDMLHLRLEKKMIRSSYQGLKNFHQRMFSFRIEVVGARWRVCMDDFMRNLCDNVCYVRTLHAPV